MRYAILLLLAAALPACTETDPMTRPYSWQPTGANALNIAAQVRNKNDLLIGRGSSRSDSVQAVTPVFKLYEGKPTPLLPSRSRSAAGGGGGGS